MKRLKIFLVVFFSFLCSIELVSAEGSECANFEIVNSNYFLILNDQEIALDESLLGSIFYSDFSLTVQTLNATDSLKYYVFKDKNTDEYMLTISNRKMYGLDSRAVDRLRYIQLDSGTGSVTLIKLKFNADYKLTSSTINHQYPAMVIEDYSANQNGVYINSNVDFMYTYDWSSTTTVEASNRCNYTPLGEINIDFEYLRGTIPGEDPLQQNVGATVNVFFPTYDVTKYKYLISFDQGQSFTEISDKMHGSEYIITKVENFNVMAKMALKDDPSANTSTSIFVDGIHERAKDFLVTWIVDKEQTEYVEIDNKKYLFKYFLSANLNYNESDKFNFYYSYDNGKTYEESIQNQIDFILLENKTITVKITDKSDSLVLLTMYDVSLFDANIELGQRVYFTENCYRKDHEDDTNTYTQKICTVRAKFVNASDQFFNYYVRAGNSEYFQITMQDLVDNTYKNESSVLTTLCVKITDKKNNLILEECYTNKNFTDNENFNHFIKNITDFINDKSGIIKDFSDQLRSFYLALPANLKIALEIVYTVMCLCAIIWNLRK